MSSSSNIVGRYAPSPTGDLHLGNLRTALLAWLHVRLQGGRFLLRMEDLDVPRVVAGSADKILQDLEWLGLDWDGPIVYQSRRTELYEAALAELDAQNLTYPCFCSRKDIQLASSAPHSEFKTYPGTCRNLSAGQIEQKRINKNPAIRIVVDGELSSTCGDFVIKRADNLFAYQLAVVVDDLEQGVTDVLRGQDLADSTSRQLYLAQKLRPSSKPLRYIHVPLMLDNMGKRMSKRDGSLSVDECRDEGYSAERLVGEFAAGIGLIEHFEEITAAELLTIIELKDLQAHF